VRQEIQQAEDAAAISVAFLALQFASLPETWPVFARWCGQHGRLSPLATRETMSPLVENMRRRVVAL
jgi:hypothetical protein